LSLPSTLNSGHAILGDAACKNIEYLVDNRNPSPAEQLTQSQEHCIMLRPPGIHATVMALTVKKRSHMSKSVNQFMNSAASKEEKKHIARLH
jgi:hypothetical protein